MTTSQDLLTFGEGEEITTCPICGSRTEFIERHDRKMHWCLNDRCNNVFMTEACDDSDA